MRRTNFDAAFLDLSKLRAPLSNAIDPRLPFFPLVLRVHSVYPHALSSACVYFFLLTSFYICNLYREGVTELYGQ